MAEDFEVSAQVLNEFANVSRKKLRQPWPEIADGVRQIVNAAEIVHPLTAETTSAALFLTSRYNVSWFDALIAGSALLAGCETLYSEDMQDGLIVEGRLTIRNPFA